MTMTGVVCTAQHMIVSYMISGNLQIKQQSKTFGIVYSGTIIDGLIRRISNKDYNSLTYTTRYFVMIATFYCMFSVQPAS